MQKKNRIKNETAAISEQDAAFPQKTVDVVSIVPVDDRDYAPVEDEDEDTSETDNEENEQEENAQEDKQTKEYEEKKKELSKYHEIVSKNLNNLKELEEALLQIRDNRLYKCDDDPEAAKSFENYCMKYFKMTRAHAYRLINHYIICEALDIDVAEIPEKVVRPLKSVNTIEACKEIWKCAQQKSGTDTPTSTIVKACVDEYKISHKKENSSHEGKVFCKCLHKYFEKDSLAANLMKEINGTAKDSSKALKDLVSLMDEFGTDLNDEDKKNLKAEGQKLLDAVFDSKQD